MTPAGRPRGICFDYGRTLVTITRPVAAIAASGLDLKEALELGERGWRGSAGEFLLALDEMVDRMVDEEQQSLLGREVDFAAVHRQAMERVLGTRPAPEVSDRVSLALQRAWVSGVAPIPEAGAVLAELRVRGLRLALCSNAPYPAEQMLDQLEQLGLRAYFDAVVFSGAVGWRKPHPRIFMEMLRRLGLPASQVWFVGDEWDADILGARAVGMRAILAPGATAPAQPGERLERWPDLLALLEQAPPG
ncbi:MAG TPA: HAD family hydrolase [Candidatus Dormibacteraeota bacterium]